MIRLPKLILVVLALAVLLSLTGSAVAADTAKGKIKSISADKKEFVLTDQNNKDWTFHLNDESKVRLANKDVTLNDLKVGFQVEITYEKQGDRLMVKQIRAEQQ
jgi:Cu/Ag efflux protein CusF